MTEKYSAPEHGWPCFHCGEIFMTTGSARDHFGADPDKQPGCMIKVQPGDERGLLTELRKAEQRIQKLEHDIACDTSGMLVYTKRLKLELQSYKPFKDCNSIFEIYSLFNKMQNRAMDAELLAQRRMEHSVYPLCGSCRIKPVLKPGLWCDECNGVK